MRKTPFQKHREEEERRKKREEEEAAKVYEDFVESFGEKPEEAEGSKSFVSGGTVQPGSSAAVAAASTGGRRGSTKYVPSFMPPSLAAAVGKPQDRDAARTAEESVFPLPSSTRADRGKTRNIDKMLEAMKRDQEARSERQRQRQERGSSFGPGGSALDDGLGSFDDGDPFTTNLYVGNLAPDVDEEVLKREFLRYGDIASIKVMWPRDEDQRRRGRNCGFVAFMTRKGAETAKDELNGALLHDLDLKIGWGKAIVLPPIPMYTSSGTGGLAPMMAAARAIAQAPALAQSATAPWGSGARDADDDPHTGAGPDIVIKAPEDSRSRFIMDSVASYVMVDGCDFELALMSRQAENPDFLFLFDLKSPEHAYYRWRLYSLAQGDSLRNWRNEPFVMVEGGPRWLPPSMTSLDRGRQQTAAQRGGEAKDKDKPLSDVQRDRFEDILRALTMERSSICDAMVFALDNADSAFEVVEILGDSLTLPETPLWTKAARLMLASDILHNSTAQVRNASRYRSLLESNLPDVFESLQETYRGLQSRMEQEMLRRNVLRVLRVWRSWFIFTDDYLNGLQATFLRSKAGDAENTRLREELQALDPEALSTRCRRNGLSRDGSTAAQIQRLVNLHAYLAGDAKEEPPPVTAASVADAAADDALHKKLNSEAEGVFAANTDPVKLEREGPTEADKPSPKAKVKAEAKPMEGPVSKWTLVDSDSETFPEPPADDAENTIFPDLERTPVAESGAAPDPMEASPEPEPPRSAAGGEGPGSTGLREAAERPDGRIGGERIDAADEGRRARLRQVEVDLLLFRESLEDKGLSRDEVEAKVAEQREVLIAGSERKAAADTPSTSDRDAAAEERRGGKKDAQKHRSKESSKRERSPSPRAERKRERAGDAAKERNKDERRERSRDRDREWKEKESSTRRRSRSRERRSKSRSRSRERSRREDRRRSRSRSRGHDRERHSRRSRSREAHREDSRGRWRDDGRSRSRERRHEGQRRSRSRDRRQDGAGRRASRSRERRSRSRERDSKYKTRERSGSRGREGVKESSKHAKREASSRKSSKRDAMERSPSKSPKKSRRGGKDGR